MQQEFVLKDLKGIFPWVSPRTLIYWSERDLLQPELQDSSGKGSTRRYSYRNLIEISFISELLRRGLPFAKIKLIINSKKYKEIIQKKKWDKIFWESQQIVSASVPMDREAAYAIEFNFTSIEDFKKKGGEYLFGGRVKGKKGHYSILLNSSILIISFHALDAFVRKQIERVLE
jgi:DNA-binding transcriptional MerR regulator